MTQMKGSEILIKCLEMEGVDYMFGLPGGVILPTFDALLNSKKLKFVLVRHEQGATHMADGYARATGKVGVCMVTSGPGATNTVTGLATANMDSVPMVCITGQVATQVIGSDAFQEADIVGITRPVTKHNFLIKDVKNIARTVREAFYIARTGRPGPVVIDFPVDVSRAVTEFEFPKKVFIRSYCPEVALDKTQVDLAVDAISKSKRPVLYVGGGAICSGAANELLTLAEKMKIPVTTTILGLGAFSETHPLSLGMLGMHGSVYANYAVQNSDALIAVGARFDDRVTGKIEKFAPHAKIIHIDIDPASISKTVKVHIPIVGDIKPVLRLLNSRLKTVRPKTGAWLKQISTWKKNHPLKSKDDHLLHPEYVISQIGEITKHKAVVVTGVGQHQMWTAQRYKFTLPRTMITSGGLGTMGYGLPAAIGAQLGCPNKTVVCIDGDGSFQMTLTELTTARAHNVPIKVVILDNGHHGMVRQWQELFYNRRYSASQTGATNPDFSEVAQAFGIFSVKISKKEEIHSAFEKILKHKGPALLHCIVVKDDNVFPMVPAGNALDQVMDMA